MAGKRIDTTPRVMWLLNHTSARKFEVPMLRRCGYEVFTPKSYPDDPNFRSASVDYSEDLNLTIPPDDLAILNEANWYEGAGKKAWEVANKYFDICFFMVFKPRATLNAARQFDGALLWRTYGLSGEDNSYTNVLEKIPFYEDVAVAIQKLGKRFWFAEAYPHLHEIEKSYIADRAVFLPLGMKGAEDKISDDWNGSDKRILFVCPDVGFNQVYIEIYKKFKKDFKGFPYAIGGAQSVSVDDEAVLGYLPFEEHLKNMREMRVMFYHSQEPRHIHFHPFEAIKAGMPLVFMSGGILDQFGGDKLPGRCTSIEDARRKIRRILDGDQNLIDDIRRTQRILIEPMKASNCEKNWQEGLSRILVETRDYLSHKKVAEVSKKIVIICDRSRQDKANQIARVLRDGAKISGDIVDIIVGLEKSSKDDIDHSGRNLKNDLIIREFVWRKINADDGQRILSYTGAQRNLVWPDYLVPDDGINNFLDCDLWFLIASEIDTPLLPLRPLALMPDTIAHRFSGRSQKFNVGRFGLAYEPDAVIVDSDFAENEFVHTEGVPLNLIHKLPSILVDDVAERSPNIGRGERSSFLWIVNPRSLPNFEPAVEALSILYNQLSYSKKCNVLVMEIETTGLKSETHPNYKRLIEKAAKRHQIPQRMLNVAKISSPRQLSFAMSEAEFLWRPAKLDDDLAPLVAFVKSGKPVIAANCPLLRERLEALGWEICTQSEESPDSMAESIKQMDASRYTSVQSLSNSRPSEQVSSAYWSVVAECL